MGCVIVRSDGAVVSSRNASTMEKRSANGSSHAEARCVRKADVGSVAYVARLFKDGRLAMARPCNACFTKLKSRGVSKIHYTISDTEYGTILVGKDVEYRR